MSSGPLVGRPVRCQCVYMLSLGLSLELSLVLYIVPIVCYAALSPLGRTSTTRHLALSLAIPRAIPLPLLSFESYLEMMLQE